MISFMEKKKNIKGCWVCQSETTNFSGDPSGRPNNVADASPPQFISSTGFQ